MGWQVAAEGNPTLTTLPDMGISPSYGVTWTVRRTKNALLRASEIEALRNELDEHLVIPIIADAESGGGGLASVFEQSRRMIEAGAGAIHLEDQIPSVKKSGHMEGKVIAPLQEHIQKLKAARLAADVVGTSTVIVSRTDCLEADYLSSDIDPRDREMITGERTMSGYHRINPSMEDCIDRAVASAPYSDAVFLETDSPDLEIAAQFAEGVKSEFPNKSLVYNCSPSFDWTDMPRGDAEDFHQQLNSLGFDLQIVSIPGYHLDALSSYRFGLSFVEDGMAAYRDLQETEKSLVPRGYSAFDHNQEVGSGYFDRVEEIVLSGARN